MNIPASFGQSTNIVEEEKQFYEQIKILRREIRRGWSADKVRDILGEPERVTHATSDTDVVEIWVYRGYQVRIEFRNGVVEKWYFWFMQ
jgi:hypothetical protein